jgi:PAS domain S-box-containing protein
MTLPPHTTPWSALAPPRAPHDTSAEALTEALRLVQATLDATHEGMVAVDELGRLTLVNARFVELWGLDAGILDGDVLPTLRARLLEQVADPERLRVELDRLRDDPMATYTGRVLLRDGRRFDWLSRPALRDGRFTGRLYSFRDVTEQAEAERALQRRLRLESAIARIAASLTGDGELDLDGVLAELGRVVDVHRAYLFRVRADGLTVDNTHEWCAANVSPEIAQLQGVSVGPLEWWFAAMRRDEPVVIEDVEQLPSEADALRALLDAQGVRALIALPIMSKEQGLLGFIGFDDVERTRVWLAEDRHTLRVVADLLATEFDRRRAAEALRAGEARLKQVLDATTDGFWDWDIANDNVVFSDRWYDMLSETPGTLSGSAITWVSRVHRDDIEAARVSCFAHLKGETPQWQAETRVKDARGAWHWILTRGRVVERDATGRATRMVGTHTDVTARRQLEEQLRQAQKMEAVGRLAGGIAHDFNNLLTAVIGHALLLLPQLEGDEGAQMHAVEIRKAADRAAQLTQQLLAFSRKQIMRSQVFDLSDVVADAESLMARLIGTNIEVTTECRHGDTFVRADPNQLQQVLLNLVVNARDAMPGGGRLLIEVYHSSLEQPVHCAIGDVPAGEWVVLSVTDTGTGIDPATLPRIFEPFFTTKEQGKGTGLGLAMVYGIVTQLGGNICVKSEPGRATTFRLFLPRAAEVPQARVRRSASPAIVRGSGRVLLVEDDATVRALVLKVLEASGYESVSAASPVEALRLAPELAPVDLILTDLVMPGMNGMELVGRLRQRWPDARVLVMSGCSDREVADSGIFEAGYDFIGKPFTPRTLTTKLVEVLRARA